MSKPKPKKKRAQKTDDLTPTSKFGWMFMRPAPGQLTEKLLFEQYVRARQNHAQRKGRRPINQSLAAHRRWLIRRIKAFNDMQTQGVLMAAHDRKIMSTDEAVAAGSEVNGAFNATMKRLGLGIRIESKTADSLVLKQLWDGAGMEALRILTGPDLYEKGPDGWCGPYLEGLLLVMLNPLPDEASLRWHSKREWESRLRQTKKGNAFREAENLHDQNVRIKESKRDTFRRGVERQHRALDRLAENDGIVPVNWPHVWRGDRYVPVKKPHQVRIEPPDPRKKDQKRAK